MFAKLKLHQSDHYATGLVTEKAGALDITIKQEEYYAFSPHWTHAVTGAC